MAFGSTITLTINATPYVLNRLNQDNYGSHYSYKGAARAISLKIRHSTDSVDGDGVVMLRHNVYVEEQVYPTPTESMKKRSFTFTMRGGEFEDPVDSARLATACLDFLSASTYAAVTDLSVGVN